VAEPIVSPTFTIGRRYRGRVPVSHLDLFRLATLAGEDPGLLDDYLTPDAVTFIEWPAVGEAAIAGRGRTVHRVEIRHAGGDEREIV
jgi:tRNA threonylcarbamoyladenosine biosynthesis protein TsaE